MEEGPHIWCRHILKKSAAFGMSTGAMNFDRRIGNRKDSVRGVLSNSKKRI